MFKIVSFFNFKQMYFSKRPDQINRLKSIVYKLKKKIMYSRNFGITKLINFLQVLLPFDCV